MQGTDAWSLVGTRAQVGADPGTERSVVTAAVSPEGAKLEPPHVWGLRLDVPVRTGRREEEEE
ncbi:hypothetical protein IAQ61_004078 [Plenodomus lingam]|uniref:uncharacterized protein n=1 Tax=Leptosphaeria maculans TaxID=5022 RepID=UPI003325F41B|nr:hypothetical protein IAQ61_004078 [Plenodomus lingam]